MAAGNGVCDAQVAEGGIGSCTGSVPRALEKVRGSLACFLLFYNYLSFSSIIYISGTSLFRSPPPGLRKMLLAREHRGERGKAPPPQGHRRKAPPWAPFRFSGSSISHIGEPKDARRRLAGSAAAQRIRGPAARGRSGRVGAPGGRAASPRSPPALPPFAGCRARLGRASSPLAASGLGLTLQRGKRCPSGLCFSNTKGSHLTLGKRSFSNVTDV